jgi:hypothetical protein
MLYMVQQSSYKSFEEANEKIQAIEEISEDPTRPGKYKGEDSKIGE